MGWHKAKILDGKLLGVHVVVVNVVYLFFFGLLLVFFINYISNIKKT